MWGTCKIVNFLTIVFNSCDWSKSFNTKKTHPFKVECKCIFRGGSTIFLGGDALVSCSTSTPINHIIFFCRIPVVLENRRSSQRGGGGGRTPCTLPLHPPLLTKTKCLKKYPLPWLRFPYIKTFRPFVLSDIAEKRSMIRFLIQPYFDHTLGLHK